MAELHAALRAAVSIGDAQELRSLAGSADCRSELNKLFVDGLTPMHRIVDVRCNKQALGDVVSTLIHLGADFDIRSTEGLNVPVYCASRDNFPAVKAIVTQLPTLAHSTDHVGFGLLHWACKQADLDAVEFLLSFNVDLNVMAANGDTPLHVLDYSREEAALRIWNTLVLHGAETVVSNAYDETAYTKRYARETVQLLPKWNELKFAQWHPINDLALKILGKEQGNQVIGYFKRGHEADAEHIGSAFFEVLRRKFHPATVGSAVSIIDTMFVDVTECVGGGRIRSMQNRLGRRSSAISVDSDCLSDPTWSVCIGSLVSSITRPSKRQPPRAVHAIKLGGVNPAQVGRDFIASCLVEYTHSRAEMRESAINAAHRLAGAYQLATLATTTPCVNDGPIAQCSLPVARSELEFVEKFGGAPQTLLFCGANKHMVGTIETLLEILHKTPVTLEVWLWEHERKEFQSMEEKYGGIGCLIFRSLDSVFDDIGKSDFALASVVDDALTFTIPNLRTNPATLAAFDEWIACFPTPLRYMEGSQETDTILIEVITSSVEHVAQVKKAARAFANECRSKLRDRLYLKSVKHTWSAPPKVVLGSDFGPTPAEAVETGASPAPSVSRAASATPECETPPNGQARADNKPQRNTSRCRYTFYCQHAVRQQCSFRHTEEELQYFATNRRAKRAYRTMACNDWIECAHKNTCNYAHSNSQGVCTACNEVGHLYNEKTCRAKLDAQPQ